jgi:hypothetical protein
MSDVQKTIGEALGTTSGGNDHGVGKINVVYLQIAMKCGVESYYSAGWGFLTQTWKTLRF